MGNFTENLNLGNRFRPPLCGFVVVIAPSIGDFIYRDSP